MMVELARHHGAGPVSLAEMADHENLPRPYLEQLVVSLREAGLVALDPRGPRRLRAQPRPGRDPDGRGPPRTRGADRADGLRQRGPAHAAICDRTGYCNVNHAVGPGPRAISEALDSMTLADLARRHALATHIHRTCHSPDQLDHAQEP